MISLFLMSLKEKAEKLIQQPLTRAVIGPNVECRIGINIRRHKQNALFQLKNVYRIGSVKSWCYHFSFMTKS